jgi:hypothetical protein
MEHALLDCLDNTALMRQPIFSILEDIPSSSPIPHPITKMGEDFYYSLLQHLSHHTLNPLGRLPAPQSHGHNTPPASHFDQWCRVTWQSSEARAAAETTKPSMGGGDDGGAAGTSSCSSVPKPHGLSLFGDGGAGAAGDGLSRSNCLSH